MKLRWCKGMYVALIELERNCMPQSGNSYTVAHGGNSVSRKTVFGIVTAPNKNLEQNENYFYQY